ncbi:thaumatin family protein [Planotetraspora phitsanulokensis]|nr:thaumatin family protein [Planotetraspora phitsanulokensis]
MTTRRRRAPGRAWQPYALVLAVVAAAVVVLVWPSSPRGSATTASAAGRSSAPADGAANPSASPSRTARPGHKPSGSPRPSASRSAPAKKTPPSGTTAKAAAGKRLFTFVNKLDQTVWLASNKSDEYPLSATGWVLRPGQTVSVQVPNKWGGRFWGRTGCSFDSSGRGHCKTGDCGGVFQCVGSTGSPTTLGEFSLAAWGGMDFYDVSMVDGYNLPMYINISGGGTKDPVSPSGCYKGVCTKAVSCPGKMQLQVGGQMVACKNPCTAFGGDTYCCRGKWAGRENCIPSKWPTDYTQVFKKAAPYAYSYAFDDSATMPCKGRCNYRVTFGIT